MNASSTDLTASLLASLSEQQSALPYLFIGSGLSRRYLGLPDWESLTRKFASEAGLDFNYIFSKTNGSFPLSSTYIADKFHERWWQDDRYKEQRSQYADLARSRKEDALKVAVAVHLKALSSTSETQPLNHSEDLRVEYDLLKRVVIDGVITTNYDSMTDVLFPSFNAYIGQDGLLFSDAQFIAETYKIHGSVEDPQSLVLTANDYEELDSRNHYLSAKLLTIFAEHPVIFAGYSLMDDYVGNILGHIATAAGAKRLSDLGRRIYFIEWNPAAESIPLIEPTSIERAGHRLPITRIETHSFQWIWQALAKLRRPFPAHILRELRKHVYDLVSDPSGASRESVRAVPLEDERGSDLRVVFGVGSFSEQDLDDLSKMSRHTLTREDLERDILADVDVPLEANFVLEFGIPGHLRPPENTYIPVHKYFYESGRVSEDGTIDFNGLDSKVRYFFTRELEEPDGAARSRFIKYFGDSTPTPTEIMKSGLATYRKFESIRLLDEDAVDLDDCREALVAYYHSSDRTPKDETYFRKTLVWYDRVSARRGLYLRGSLR